MPIPTDEYSRSANGSTAEPAKNIVNGTKEATKETAEKASDEAKVDTPDDTPEADPGMITEVKNLYQGKKDSDGKRPWVEQYPDDLDDPVENERSARYALLIRNVKSYEGKRKTDIDSIIIQSPLIRDALKKVLDNYPGITTGLDRMKIKPNFEAFVHRWPKLRTAIAKATDPATKSHLQLLHDVLEAELADDIKARDDLLAHKAIDFHRLWMIFEPGSTVFSTNLGQPCAALLDRGSYSSDQCGAYFYLRCNFLQWDGKKFGSAVTGYKIREFEGTCPISQLTAFPMHFHPDEKNITAKLIARGKEFERLSGYHFKAYKGLAIGKGLQDRPVAFNVNSRIIIDTYAWNRFQPNDQIYVGGMISAKTSKTTNEPVTESGTTSPAGDDEDEEYEDCDTDDEEYDEDYDDYPIEALDDLGALREALNQDDKPMKARPLTDGQLLLCTNTLRGYSLKDKKWLTLFLECVQEIKWNDHAFDRLVLPENQKELVLALTESQRDNRNTFEDMIQGKGMGMIMLLSGPPGVGKTLTAEAVAENMKAPLYMMSAGDLGTDADDVETNLSNVLEMCTKWGAVLLLDEADVFLEQRTTHDLERNKLVSSKYHPLSILIPVHLLLQTLYF